MRLADLHPAPGARHREKRVGRGPGSGHGKTSTRGHKGQKARSGGAKGRGFEGGQMPLIRRLPKRGFSGPPREPHAIVNLRQLEPFEGTVSPAVLKDAGLIKASVERVKVLGTGELMRAVVVQAHAFSEGAKAKIEQAGGRAETIP